MGCEGGEKENGRGRETERYTNRQRDTGRNRELKKQTQRDRQRGPSGTKTDRDREIGRDR